MLIGILGGAGSGKTTAADYIVETFGGKRFSFAEPLKAILRDVFDMSEEQLYGKLKEVTDPRYNFSPRWLMRRLGTEGIRKHLGQDVWARALIESVDKWRKTGGEGVAVIDDVRFRNEADIVKQHGGWLLHLVRESPIAHHQSELERLSIGADFVVDNNGSLEETLSSIQHLVRQHRGRGSRPVGM